METMELAPGLCLGLETIDREHARFFELMNRLMASDATDGNRELIGEILEELVGYVRDHFETEEDLMVLHGYPELESHLMKHVQFAAMVENFHTKYVNEEIGLDDEVLGYLVEWFTNHIRVEDPKYVDLFKQNGVR